MTPSTATFPGRIDYFHNKKANAKLAYGAKRQEMLSVSKA